MEIINKATPVLTGEATIYFGKDQIFFSKRAVNEFGIFPGLGINFAFDGGRLFFYCDNNSDSMPIRIKSPDNTTLINAVSALIALRKRLPHLAPGAKHPLKLHPTKINGNQLVEVLLHKRVKPAKTPRIKR